MKTSIRKVAFRRVAVFVAVAVWIVLGGLAASGRAAEEGRPATLDDLDTIKQRILAPLLDPVDAAAARRLLGTLEADGSWPAIDYGLQRRSSWTTAAHLGNLLVLARAYRGPRSELHGDAAVRRALLAGLDYWLEHDFRNPNWWWNEIGVPRSLAPVLLLIEEELSESQREAGLAILGRAQIGKTGQNLVWVTEITALRGILQRDPQLVATAYRRIADEIRVGTGEGIQPDFSFHQHGPCLYNHGYGAAFAVDCPRIASQVAGTTLAFSPEKIALLSRMLLDGSQWMVRGTATDFGAEGREITRQGQSAGYLATAAEYMLQVPTGREEEFRALAARASGRAAPPLEGNRHFPRSDMMTHHRQGFYTSARMFSSRIANTDNPCNDEGLKSHHLADGCNIVMQTGREYRDIFPLWDWQKIPGTTVEQKPRLEGSPRSTGKRSFVGGVSDGTYGLAALDLARGPLTARKSWFFFDRQYVCLGAGIACASDNPVATTLNQCNLQGDVLVMEASQVRTLERGEHGLGHRPSVWHDGVVYTVLQQADLRLQNDVQRGSWNAINRRYSQEEVGRDVFSLWIDHGRRPDGASYAYAVTPGVEQASFEKSAAGVPVEILANQSELQAVRHPSLGIAGAAFYRPGSVEIRPGLTLAVDTPCLVLLREVPEKIVLWMSNPENREAAVCVELGGRWLAEGAQLLEGPTRTRVTVALPGGVEAGGSVPYTLRRP